MPRPRRSNLSRQCHNARRIRNIANETTEEAQGIAREERRVSMARLRASQSQEQSEAARETARLAMRNRRANNRDQQVDLVVQTNVPLLNRQQKEVYNTLMKAIDDGNGGLYFLDAPGRTGKTFLMSGILATVRAKLLKVITVPIDQRNRLLLQHKTIPKHLWLNPLKTVIGRTSIRVVEPSKYGHLLTYVYELPP